jgi:hypothetical protein
MVALPWALENQQSFAQWCSQPSIAAEYSRLGANKIS